jgi:hypothetical protein
MSYFVVDANAMIIILPAGLGQREVRWLEVTRAPSILLGVARARRGAARVTRRISWSVGRSVSWSTGGGNVVTANHLDLVGFVPVMANFYLAQLQCSRVQPSLQ